MTRSTEGSGDVSQFEALTTALAATIGTVSVISLPLVWSLADITNGLMAIPNLFSLLALQGILVAETRKYLWDKNLELSDGI